MKQLSIVMYHYVRDLQKSSHPTIKGLDVAGFRRQLDFFAQEYHFIEMNDVIAAIKENHPLPARSCLLTFDDGLKDHFQFVFPELLKRKIKGAFFPPVVPIMEQEILDVHKVHFILASSLSPLPILEKVKDLYHDFYLEKETGKSYEQMISNVDLSSRFDSPETILAKRLLQHLLPEKFRNLFVAHLFSEFVSQDTKAFAQELYMSPQNLQEMVNEGMYVGSHGYRHVWLDQSPRDDQEQEIKKAISFLQLLGAPTKDWVMCYPYGAFNQDTLEILNQYQCLIGLNTKVGLADLDLHPHLELPRFDTIDFPS